jgi:thiamine-monophosphate kinase
MRSEVVSDLTEAELIARIQQQLPPRPDWLLVGIGDDAAVVEPERNRVEVLTVDALVEGVHFDRAFVPPDAIGHRALAVNLSDLAAMGATPRLALLSMALPAALPLADFDGLIAGFTALAAAHRLHLAGGNLTHTTGPMMLDVTLLGNVKRRQALRRSGARPGDVLYVSGTLGAAGAGLRMLQERNRLPTAEDRADDGVEDTAEHCIARYLRPEPRVRLGTLLSRNRAATACMDLSDGLADAVRQVARASGVGAIIDREALPIAPAARDWLGARGLDPVDVAMSAGDDYELLVAAGPRGGRRLAAATRGAGVPLTRIGVCTAGPEVVVRSVKGDTTTDTSLPQGYGHFR